MFRPPACILVAIALPIFVARGAQTPVSFSGFNQDIVIESGTPVDTGAFANAVTATMDGGTGKTGTTWYAVGEDTDAPTTGLPMGTTFTSGADSSTSFALPSAVGNNAVLLNAVTTSATLTLNTPAMFASLSLLGASANGSTTVSVTLEFSDATNLSLGNFVISDWFNGSNPAYTANGRATMNPAGFTSVNLANPRLYQIDLALPQAAMVKNISGISLGFIGTGTNELAVFALSGQTVPEPTSTVLIALATIAGAVVARRR